MTRKLAFGILLGLGFNAFPSQASTVPIFVGQGPAQPFRCFEDDHGGFYLVWVAGETGKVFSLVSQHLNAEGRALWPNPGLLISSQTISSEDWSGLADGQGGLTLFWDEADGVHVQRFSPDGTRRRVGNSIRISTSTAIQPDAVADAIGGTLVVWRQTLAGGRSVVLAQRVSADGKPLWTPGGLRVSLRASHQTNPRVVYDNMSGMIVAWRDEVNQSSELRVQRIDFEGNRLWTLEGLRITSPVGMEEFPVIVPAGTGSVVVTWPETVDQTNQIRLQKVGPDPGLKWESPVFASNGADTYNRWNPHLLGDETGGTWIVWEDYRNQLNYQLELNHLNADGASVWPAGEMAIAPAPGDQGMIAITGNGNNGVWVAWIDNRLATIGLYVQGVDGSGKRLLGDGGRLIADHLPKPSRPQLVALATGRTAVVWADRPKKGQWTLSWAAIELP
jgi:hypothetical protein